MALQTPISKVSAGQAYEKCACKKTCSTSRSLRIKQSKLCNLLIHPGKDCQLRKSVAFFYVIILSFVGFLNIVCFCITIKNGLQNDALILPNVYNMQKTLRNVSNG